MPDSVRTLVLGLDAFSPALAEEFAPHLPTITHLLATGSVGTMEHEFGYFVGSIWPTLMSGQPVAAHEWYTGTRFRPYHYDYEMQPFSLASVWQQCSDAGARVAVLDVPFFPVAEGLNGVQLVEWGCHDHFFGPGSWPPGLHRDLDRRFGTHPLGTWFEHPDIRVAPCDHAHRKGERRTPDELATFYVELVEGLQRKAEVSLQLLSRGPWDLFLNVLGEPHCAGHHLWRLHDRSHPRHDPALAARLAPETGDPLLDVYRLLDGVVARHLDAVGDSTVCYVLLSHGMGPHYGATHMLPQLLHRLDAAWRGQRGGGRGERMRQLDRQLDRLPAPARRRAVRALWPAAVRRYRGGVESAEEQLPPLNERAFFALDNNSTAGAIRVNLQGRERTGVVTYDDLDRVLDYLTESLLELVDVNTGRPVVTSVRRSTDVHGHHPVHHALADLLVEWDRALPTTSLWSPRVGRLTLTDRVDRSGDHLPGGLVVATGPGIAPRRVELDPLDLAPTIAASIGVDLSHMPGRPAAALLPPVRATRPVEPEGAAVPAATLADVVAFGAWVRNACEPATNPLVSVVIPTRNRSRLTVRAVSSVLRQRYEHLEVLVVDDASDDDTLDVLASLEDPRLRVLRHDRRTGGAAARNTGLDAARGQVVAHLDSDNSFDPDWLLAAVWAFEQHPESHWLYGARVVDDVERHHDRPAGGMPWLQLLPWNAQVFRERCTVDMNVLAHRATDLRFDPTLDVMEDWQFMLQLLHRHGNPVRVPAIAAYYSTDGPDRVSARPWAEKEPFYLRIREQWGDGRW